MAITKLERVIELDIYNHDTTPSTIKAIACDNDTRYVAAEIQYEGVWYDIGENSTVELTIIRPDKVGVSISGQVYPFTYESGGEQDPETGDFTPVVTQTYYGVYAELDQPALLLSGTLLAQFKITSGTQILRTEIFYINNGRALDAEVTEWSEEFNTYNLDELAEKIDFVLNALQDLVGSDVNIQAAITTTQTYVDNRISVHDNGIYINA